METSSFGSRVALLYGWHKKLFNAFFVVIGLWILLTWLGSLSELFKSADVAKQYILSFGAAAPLFFIGLQVLQVIVAPIPGQAAGFAGGYVFGWKWGIVYTMIGLTLGSFIVFVLSRRLGRGFVDKLNGAEAVRDFEELFLPSKNQLDDPPQESKEDVGARRPKGRFKWLFRETYDKSKETVSSHGLLTFFLIMLLPGLPDDLVCFVGGLTRIPIWQLVLATIVGRFPGMLVLSLVGDGFSKAQSNKFLFIFMAFTVLLTALYLWKRQGIEERMKKAAGLKGGVN